MILADFGLSSLNGDIGVILALILITFSLGVLLGFIGAGGAGLTVALLTSVFGLPVHEAIGTGLIAMCFVSVSGTASHYRHGNIDVRAGVLVGISGVAGAIAGANLGQGIPEPTLKVLAGSALWFLALLVWLRTRYADQILAIAESGDGHPRRDLVLAILLGLGGGVASAFFGVGMAPLLQLGLLTVLHLPLRQSVGTTMLTLIFVSLSGGISMAFHGDVSGPHLIGTIVGLSSGSYIGARYTGRAPRQVLRSALVGTPLLAGAMLIFL